MKLAQLDNKRLEKNMARTADCQFWEPLLMEFSYFCNRWENMVELEQFED